jgi:hypothetical protein
LVAPIIPNVERVPGCRVLDLSLETRESADRGLSYLLHLIHMHACMMICTDRSGHHSLTTILSRLGLTPPSRPSEEAEAGSESGSPTSMFKARNGATDLDPSPAVSGESRLSRCDRRTPDSSWLLPEQLAAGCGSSWPAATLPTGACKLHTIRFYIRFIHTVPSRVLGSRNHQMNGISLSAGRNMKMKPHRHSKRTSPSC